MEPDEGRDTRHGFNLDFVDDTRLYRRPAWWRSERIQRWLGVVAVLLVAIVLLGTTDKGHSTIVNVRSYAASYGHKQATLSTSEVPRGPVKHLLIPGASHSSQHLCKLLLTTSALGYPPPHLLSWNQSFARPNMAFRGAQIGKIENTADYLNHLGRAQDDELVLIVDGYDIWFQLPVEVFASRYYEVLRRANDRLQVRHRPTAAGQMQGNDPALRHRIVFGAGKHCTPNQLHTMACYPIPMSPVSADVYGGNTDTVIGWSKRSSFRPRYLNSGYIIGPVRDMRRMFTRAKDITDGWQKLWTAIHIPTNDPQDDGSRTSEYFYHGSDQSVFNKLFGRQEYVREVLRRRRDPDAIERSSRLEGTKIPDILKPPFKHESWNKEKFWSDKADELKLSEHLGLQLVDHADPWKADVDKLLDDYDFGMTLDYYSDLGHNTEDSERDASWLRYDEPPVPQVEIPTHDPFACSIHLESLKHLPEDVLGSKHPREKLQGNASHPRSPSDDSSPWVSTPLYTNLCLSNGSSARVPALIHHNGDKTPLNTAWHNMDWLYKLAKPLLEAEGQKTSGFDHNSGDREGWLGRSGRGAPSAGGAWAGSGFPVSWGQACPADLLQEGAVFGPG